MNMKRGEKAQAFRTFQRYFIFVLGRKQCFPDFKITEQKLCELSIDGRKVNFLPLKSKQCFYRILDDNIRCSNQQKKCEQTKKVHFCPRVLAPYLLSSAGILCHFCLLSETSIILMSCFSDSLCHSSCCSNIGDNIILF